MNECTHINFTWPLRWPRCIAEIDGVAEVSIDQDGETEIGAIWVVDLEAKPDPARAGEIPPHDCFEPPAELENAIRRWLLSDAEDAPHAAIDDARTELLTTPRHAVK